MPNLMARAQSLLNSRVEEAAGASVTYSRGRTGQSVALTAAVGRTVFASNGADGPRVDFGERDYLILAADLVLGGAAAEPEEGDRVSETIGGVEHTFKIMPTATGEPAWRWSDPGRTKYRLHVKRVG